MESIERYEQKFLLSPRHARLVKQYIRPFVQADHFSKNGRYKVLSLYLDGVNRPLYQATKNQYSKRLKLRIRTYGSDTVFLEIKRKIRGMIWKSRVKLNLQQYQVIFNQRQCQSSRNQVRSIKEALTKQQQNTLTEFLFWRDRYQAEPHYWVGYEREGYQSPDGDYARVTFDYRIKSKVTQSFHIPNQITSAYENKWQHIDFASHLRTKSADIILELKSEKLVPEWMSHLSRDFTLSALGVSKYALAIDCSDILCEKYRLTEQISAEKGRFNL